MKRQNCRTKKIIGAKKILGAKKTVGKEKILGVNKILRTNKIFRTNKKIRVFKKYKPYLLLAPFLILMLVMFFPGLINGIVQSLGYMPYFNQRTLTFKYYEEIFRDKDFWIALGYSIYLSLVSSIVSVVLGVVAAFFILWLSQKSLESRLLSIATRIPMIMPHLVVIVLIHQMFSQTGLGSRIAANIGLISDPGRWPLLVYDRWGIGILLVYLYKQIPFVAMTVFAVLKSIHGKWQEVAYNLGANRFQTYTGIILPMLFPTILSVLLILFAYNFGAFEVPFLIGSPVIETLPVKAYSYYTHSDFTLRPYAMVVNVLILGISVGFMGVYVKVFKAVTRE